MSAFPQNASANLSFSRIAADRDTPLKSQSLMQKEINFGGSGSLFLRKSEFLDKIYVKSNKYTNKLLTSGNILKKEEKKMVCGKCKKMRMH